MQGTNKFYILFVIPIGYMCKIWLKCKIWRHENYTDDDVRCIYFILLFSLIGLWKVYVFNNN